MKQVLTELSKVFLH